MLLKWTGARVALEGPQDFKSFKVVVAQRAADAATLARAFDGVARFEGLQTAWVSEAALRAWPGQAQDAAWQQGLDAMIARARPHGWIDDDARAIRAHVVYEEGSVS